MARRLWELHGDGRTVTPGAVVDVVDGQPTVVDIGLVTAQP